MRRIVSSGEATRRERVRDRDPDRLRAEVEPHQRPPRRQRRREVRRTSATTLTAPAPRPAPRRRWPPAPAGVAGVLRPRLGEDRRGLVPPAEHAERADQPRPVLRRPALGGEPRRQPVDHAGDHRLPVGRRHRLRGGDVGGGRPRPAPRPAAQPASRAASASPARDGRDPGRVGRSLGHAARPDALGEVRPPALQQRQRGIVAPGRIGRVERQRPRQRRLRLRRDVAAGGDDPHLGEIDEIAGGGARRRGSPPPAPAPPAPPASGRAPARLRASSRWPSRSSGPGVQRRLQPLHQRQVLGARPRRRRRRPGAAAIASASAWPGRLARASARAPPGPPAAGRAARARRAARRARPRRGASATIIAGAASRVTALRRGARRRLGALGRGGGEQAARDLDPRRRRLRLAQQRRARGRPRPRAAGRDGPACRSWPGRPCPRRRAAAARRRRRGMPTRRPPRPPRTTHSATIRAPSFRGGPYRFARGGTTPPRLGRAAQAGPDVVVRWNTFSGS